MSQEKQQHAKQVANLRASVRQEVEASIGQPLPPDVQTLQSKVGHLQNNTHSQITVLLPSYPLAAPEHMTSLPIHQVDALQAELAEAANMEGMSDARSKLQDQRSVMDQQRKTIVQLQEQLKAMAEQHAVRRVVFFDWWLR